MQVQMDILVFSAINGNGFFVFSVFHLLRFSLFYLVSASGHHIFARTIAFAFALNKNWRSCFRDGRYQDQDTEVNLRNSRLFALNWLFCICTCVEVKWVWALASSQKWKIRLVHVSGTWPKKNSLSFLTWKTKESTNETEHQKRNLMLTRWEDQDVTNGTNKKYKQKKYGL